MIEREILTVARVCVVPCPCVCLPCCCRCYVLVLFCFVSILSISLSVQCRMCCSTTAEIVLPVLVMLIMVGLRAAVSKDTNTLQLHVRNTTASLIEEPLLSQLHAAGVPTFGNMSLDTNV